MQYYFDQQMKTYLKTANPDSVILTFWIFWILDLMILMMFQKDSVCLCACV